MKIPGTISTAFLLVALFSSETFAGGAIMATKQRAGEAKKVKQQQQIQIERHRQFILQQQVVELEIIKEDVAPQEIKDIVDITDIFKALETSSKAWALMIDAEAKEMVVQHFIDTFRQQNAVIRKPAHTYVPLIDEMARNQPQMLENPFENILRLTAIMEYDFDIGQDKDALAKKMLGGKAYVENKKRLAKRPTD